MNFLEWEQEVVVRKTQQSFGFQRAYHEGMMKAALRGVSYVFINKQGHGVRCHPDGTFSYCGQGRKDLLEAQSLYEIALSKLPAKCAEEDMQRARSDMQFAWELTYTGGKVPDWRWVHPSVMISRFRDWTAAAVALMGAWVVPANVLDPRTSRAERWMLWIWLVGVAWYLWSPPRDDKKDPEWAAGHEKILAACLGLGIVFALLFRSVSQH